MLSEGTLSMNMLLNTYLDIHMSMEPNHTIDMTVNIHIQQTYCQSTLQQLHWITHTTLRHGAVQHLTRHCLMAYGQNIEGSNGPGPLLACWPVVIARCHDLHHVHEFCDLQNLYKFAHYIISAVHKPSARGQLFNRFLQQKPHILVEVSRREDWFRICLPSVWPRFCQWQTFYCGPAQVQAPSDANPSGSASRSFLPARSSRTEGVQCIGSWCLCLTYTHVSSQSCVHVCENFFVWIMCVNLAIVTNEHVYVCH